MEIPLYDQVPKASFFYLIFVTSVGKAFMNGTVTTLSII